MERKSGKSGIIDDFKKQNMNFCGWSSPTCKGYCRCTRNGILVRQWDFLEYGDEIQSEMNLAIEKKTCTQ